MVGEPCLQCFSLSLELSTSSKVHSVHTARVESCLKTHRLGWRGGLRPELRLSRNGLVNIIISRIGRKVRVLAVPCVGSTFEYITTIYKRVHPEQTSGQQGETGHLFICKLDSSVRSALAWYYPMKL